MLRYIKHNLINSLVKLGLRLYGTKIGKGVVIEGRGRFTIGKDVVIGDYTQIAIGKHAHLTIGDNTSFGRFNRITCLNKLDIGNDTLTGQCVSIMDNQHRTKVGNVPFKNQPHKTEYTSIGNNVWLGANVVVTYGVLIGDNVVVGANAVVNKDLKSNTVNAGVPCTQKKALKIISLPIDPNFIKLDSVVERNTLFKKLLRKLKLFFMVEDL